MARTKSMKETVIKRPAINAMISSKQKTAYLNMEGLEQKVFEGDSNVVAVLTSALEAIKCSPDNAVVTIQHAEPVVQSILTGRFSPDSPKLRALVKSLHYAIRKGMEVNVQIRAKVEPLGI